jgi:ATP-dependent Clp protease ATP-binding subunit ClpA
LKLQKETFRKCLKTELFELDTGALLAGTSYKGEIEDRLKKVINECKKIEKAILFIDEIHTLLDPKGSIGNVANL